MESHQPESSESSVLIGSNETQRIFQSLCHLMVHLMMELPRCERDEGVAIFLPNINPTPYLGGWRTTSETELRAPFRSSCAAWRTATESSPSFASAYRESHPELPWATSPLVVPPASLPRTLPRQSILLPAARLSAGLRNTVRHRYNMHTPVEARGIIPSCPQGKLVALW